MLRLPRLVLVLPLVCGVLTSAASAQVTITDLGLVSDGVSSAANAINSAGDIAGISGRGSSSPANRAVLWRNGIGTELDLGCPSCQSSAADINDAGEIVGFLSSTTNVVFASAFHWHNGVTTILPPLPGHHGAAANSINNMGVVVGQSNGPGGSVAVRWVNGIPESLGTLSPAATFGVAHSINDAGVVVGAAGNGLGPNVAFVWEHGVMSSLGSLNPACSNASQANGINEAGIIVGSSTVVGSCNTVAVRWVNGVLEPLPMPIPTALFASALDINEAGDIVGNAGPGGQQSATLWRGGVPVALGGQPGTVQSIASDINDAGVIAARSIFGGTPPAFRGNTIVVSEPNSPPTLTLPVNVVVDATSPGGAIVSFAATANDDEDGAFLPACTPASGSLFAIGTTTVSCTATDSGGLDATGSFTVTVLGATAQIDALIADVTGVGPRSLENTLRVARAAIVAQRPLTAAVTLTVFDLQVTLLAITRRLPAEQAVALIGASRQIRTLIGY